MVNTCTHFCRISHVKLEFFNFCSNFSNFSRFSQMPLDHCISQKNVKIFLLAHCRSLTHIRPTESFTGRVKKTLCPKTLRLFVSESTSRRVAQRSSAKRSARARVYFSLIFSRFVTETPLFFNFSIFQFFNFQFFNF